MYFSKSIFPKALSALQFTPEIDLFASRLNKQIDKYVSFNPDPEAFEVDVIFMSWTNLKFYAFPPFSCFSQCLQRINLEKATGIIVVPRWTTQPFYSVLLRMLVRDPTVMKKSEHNLVMPVQPNMKSKVAKKSDLLICLVSGKTLCQLDHQKSLCK